MAFGKNGEYEALIEQITDVIVARLNGDGGEQAAMCGCTSECFHRCPERMHRIVDAGAARGGHPAGQLGLGGEWRVIRDAGCAGPLAVVGPGPGQIEVAVEQGASFSDALRRHPKVFDELFAYLCVHGASSAWFRLK